MTWAALEAARSNTQGGTAGIPGAWHVLGVPSCPEPPGARRGGVQEPSWGAAKGALCWPCRATHDGESLGEATDLDVHLALVGSVLGPGSRLSLGPGLGWSLGPVVRGRGIGWASVGGVSGQWQGEVSCGSVGGRCRSCPAGGVYGPLHRLGGSGEFGWGWGRGAPDEAYRVRVRVRVTSSPKWLTTPRPPAPSTPSPCASSTWGSGSGSGSGSG